MAISDYTAALKQGRRSYQAALTKGEYPYLPVLDDILSYSEVTTPINLGLIDIPLSRIVGTKTAGRTNAFAHNFLPLLPENSEFAFKWSALYEHQVDDGIRDPIVAYEFMNQFYVLEGNKRVSVMKFLGTYSIPGTVTRLIPKRSDEKENRLYYEFLDFYEVSKYCNIWFTREGSYAKLLKLMGKQADEAWSDEDTLFFHSTYCSFEKAFAKAHGAKLDLTVSDAFLIYVEIYGYEQVSQESEQEMLTALQKLWTEIKLADKGNPVELLENPEESKSSLLGRLIPTGSISPETLKIAFIYPKTTETSGWTYAHELGRLHLEQAFDGKIETLAIDRADTEETVQSAIEQAVESGCNLIFTTASQMINQSVRSAVLHPKLRIYNCSILMSYSSVCTYYARVYEAKFLMGAIAAALSRTDRLGYVADYPVYGATANINAFALGAKMINPYVKVHLEWSKIPNANPRERLQQEGIVFISDNDIITPEHASREYGLYIRKEDGNFENLATPILHWGKFYELIVRNICRGNSDSGAQKGKKALNYWWGMSADVIDLICSPSIPQETFRLIEFLKDSIRSGSFQPFSGLIRSQDGEIRCQEQESLKPEEIITMDWLADNVVGQIPEFDELTEEARVLLQLQGIKTDESKTDEPDTEK
ncbi:MAG: BMP family ABC transporter substrate-binding protein [Clostridium sp.]|nr:BMP family ABC transporter substrate-binding protein [Acetatifactor muris]MCM1527615.1 BMP family ABC transporter substrate-binding protein [Bacteroides sp.]MCM1563856.1 BMP family ABC transporter substrate-binding protein [Clostridium sp.]